MESEPVQLARSAPVRRIAASLIAATLLGIAGNAQAGKDLDAVRARGQVVCGVTTGGISCFMSVDSQGKWVGLDVDICRAASAAIFSDSEKVKFVPVTAIHRFTPLQPGESHNPSNNPTSTRPPHPRPALASPRVPYNS